MNKIGTSNVPWSIWIGYDPREDMAFRVCRHSIQRHLITPIPTYGLLLSELREEGLYNRPTEHRDGRLFDVISDAPMSTEFAVSRFLVPILAKQGRKEGEAAGWALFMDCDMLVQTDLGKLFEMADPRYAVMCVKHRHQPEHKVKMDDQAQLQYARKNWSSVMLFNCDHPANDALTVEMVNTVPGRDLHRFAWLEDDELIGELSPEWNWLVGHNKPNIIHYTEGGPWFEDYQDVEYAGEWLDELRRSVVGNRASGV